MPIVQLFDHSFPRYIVERFWSKVDKPSTGCWPWTGATSSHRYGNFVFWLAGKRYQFRPSRFAWLIVFGEPLPPSVCHKCDYPPCTRPEHFFGGTQWDNAQDAISKGRYCHGEAVNTAKLTENDVRFIRVLAARRDKSGKELAAMFGVSEVNISYIISRKIWKAVR